VSRVESIAAAEQIASLEAMWLVVLGGAVLVALGVTYYALRLVLRDYEEGEP
jgi:hypothetical protein